MSQQTIENSEQKSSWVSLLAVAIVIVALVLYYTLIDQGYWIRLGALLGGIILAVIIVALSPDGRRLLLTARTLGLRLRRLYGPLVKSPLK